LESTQQRQPGTTTDFIKLNNKYEKALKKTFTLNPLFPDATNEQKWDQIRLMAVFNLLKQISHSCQMRQ
jgi:hypothetical protein